ncbi:CBO0543 family protein [Guptibacillus hwajinpoensis]|uniref:Membrane protein YhdT n=1 Tax=Guptibacillus hwajinpoensis TaxID=208199 RepID=A0ABU0K2Q8_9BACL|nr:CBO0543 family protein [Alkalihalobacillus hemicentroti]MDQ0483645.1 putative membrane protein YhdT [Alkalihalobacillus hemicentroti]
MDEKTVLWILAGGGICLLLFNLSKSPFKDRLIVFLITSYYSSILGIMVVGEGMLSYPVNLFNNQFNSSLTYEYILFPLLGIYYYQTTYYATWKGIIWQAVLYSIGITVIEVVLEKYTDFINYESWTWFYTLVSTFVFFVIVRYLMKFITYKDQQQK